MKLFCFMSCVVLATTSTKSESDPCSPLPYEIFWNVGEADPPFSVSQYYIFSANSTQTGNGCSNPNCKAWSQGQFPMISSDGEIMYGGVPQNSNLSAHLQKLEETVISWIPDPIWSGNAVLDFESWTTVWDLNTGSGDWHSKRYQNYSIYLEKEKHPDWNDSEIVAEAKRSFEAAATVFFVKTLETLRTLRPLAKWGYYGLPMNFLEPCEGSGKDIKCGYDSSMGDVYRGYSDKQISIWEASTALFPSIYFAPFQSTDVNAAYVKSVVKETVRCAGGKIPVYPFHWNYYHNGTTLLNNEDLLSGLLGPYNETAQGVVIWGSGTELKDASFLKYVTEDVGPISKDFIQKMCDCSKENCSGHGRCMPSSSTPVACQCYSGYSGPKCKNAG